MRPLLAFLLLALTGDPVVIDPTGNEPRVVIVVIDGKAYQVQTVPVVTPSPIPPGPTPNPTPEPPPGPPPAPDIDPTPIVVGTLHVSVVTDLDTLTPDMTPVRLGKEIRAQQGPLDFAYRVYPSTSPALDALNLRFKYQSIGLPALIIQDAAGKVLDVMACPIEESAVLAKIRSYREGK